MLLQKKEQTMTRFKTGMTTRAEARRTLHPQLLKESKPWKKQIKVGSFQEASKQQMVANGKINICLVLVCLKKKDTLTSNGKNGRKKKKHTLTNSGRHGKG